MKIRNTMLPVSLVLIMLPAGAIAAHHSGNTEDKHAEEMKAHKGHKMHKKHEMMLKRVDTNEDGKIDLSEYLSHSESRFKKLDLDGDGYVTPEEHREAGRAMRVKHRELRQQRRAERQAKRVEEQSLDEEDK